MNLDLSDWVMTFAGDFHRELHLRDQLLRLSVLGLKSAFDNISLDELRGSAIGAHPTGRHSKDIEDALNDKQLAAQEIDRGYPLLYGQATTQLWTCLESLFRSLLARYLTNHPEVLSIERIGKIRISFADYHALSEEDRGFFLLQEIEKEFTSSLKQGINRFENVLDVLGLGTNVSEETSRTLFELSHVRNVLVHRNGIADRRLCAACPWLGLNPGQELRVTREEYSNYFQAVDWYSVDIAIRLIKPSLEEALEEIGISGDFPEEDADDK